jgi:hypothetical protein
MRSETNRTREICDVKKRGLRSIPPEATHRAVENNKVVHDDSVLVAILAQRDVAPEEEKRERKNH